ncbi:hypothetical protein MUU72_23605 [Streptomyces sp. RS10V-4]|uniref:hypothetical protein n=1 Tax=Streptomyces rhizoryzae TaxID=2932493 RepID=UPI0020053BA6|nr:hypothetical protein [Streptomyces rhizoryzae]MCK7626055.1 hypothetical protein [Streptomyces rhizoryzae]
MPQWDEDRQDWTGPTRPAGPPRDVRSRRSLVAVITLTVLIAAAVAGVWLLARDSRSDGPDVWPTPTDSWSTPSDSWSTPTDPWSTPTYSWSTPTYSWSTPTYSWPTPGYTWSFPTG